MDMMITMAREFGTRYALNDLAAFFANRDLSVIANAWSDTHTNALADHLRVPVTSIPDDIIRAAAEAYEAEMDRILEPEA